MSAILEAATQAATIGTQLIPLARIRVVRNQRHDVGDVTSLADSIRQHGLLQPIVVSPDGDDYVLVAGERRLAAVTSLGFEEVEAKVRTRDALDQALVQFDENDKREDLNPLERAEAIQGLLELGLSVEDVPARTGYPGEVVSASLSVLSLPEQLRQAYALGELELAEAREYARILDHPEHLEQAIQKVTDYGWSVDGAVRTQLEAIKREERTAKARARIEKLGLREVPLEEYHRGSHASLGEEYGQVNVALKEHRKHDCHAAVVDYDFKVHELCTDPESHGKLYNVKRLTTVGSADDGQSRAQSSSQKAAQTRAANKLLRAAIEPRRAVIRQLMTGEIESDPGDMAWVRDMVLAKQDRELEFAAEIMGLNTEAEGGKRSGYRFQSPGVTAFRRWAATVSPEQALIALLLARAEEAMSNTKSIHSGYLDDSNRNRRRRHDRDARRPGLRLERRRQEGQAAAAPWRARQEAPQL